MRCDPLSERCNGVSVRAPAPARSTTMTSTPPNVGALFEQTPSARLSRCSLVSELRGTRRATAGVYKRTCTHMPTSKAATRLDSPHASSMSRLALRLFCICAIAASAALACEPGYSFFNAAAGPSCYVGDRIGNGVCCPVPLKKGAKPLIKPSARCRTPSTPIKSLSGTLSCLGADDKLVGNTCCIAQAMFDKGRHIKSTPACRYPYPPPVGEVCLTSEDTLVNGMCCQTQAKHDKRRHTRS